MITNIRLQQFRSYQDASFEFEDGVNIIVGPNASGKTNLLEAVLVMAQGSSYRAQPSELVMRGKSWARIDSDAKAVHRTVKIEDAQNLPKKSFTIDGQVTSRLGPKNQLPVVLFEPNHLLMLGGSPELRRLFVDDLISQITYGYASTLRQYRRVLSQRNKLLKTGGGTGAQQMFAWNVRLSQLASQLVKARQDIITQLNKQLATTYSNLVGHKTKLTIAYSSTANPESYASQLLKRLERDYQLDLARGFTGAGPHREDIIFELAGQPLATTASRGETRTVLLALKIIELRIVETATNQQPLLLLDDVFSELDGSRRRALTELMQSHQTFITTTDADIIARHFTNNANIILLAS